MRYIGSAQTADGGLIDNTAENPKDAVDFREALRVWPDLKRAAVPILGREIAALAHEVLLISPAPNGGTTETTYADAKSWAVILKTVRFVSVGEQQTAAMALKTRPCGPSANSGGRAPVIHRNWGLSPASARRRCGSIDIVRDETGARFPKLPV